MRYPMNNDQSLHGDDKHFRTVSVGALPKANPRQFSSGQIAPSFQQTPKAGRSEPSSQNEDRQDTSFENHSGQRNNNNDNDEHEFRILYMEIERIGTVLQSRLPEPHEKISLTSTFNKEAEILPSMHEKIMRLIKAMVPNSTPQQKDAFIRDLFDMGIRVGLKSTIRSQLEDDFSRSQEKEGSQPVKETIKVENIPEQYRSVQSVKKVESLDELDDEVNSMIEKVDGSASEPSRSIAIKPTTSSEAVDRRWERLRDKALSSANYGMMASETISNSSKNGIDPNEDSNDLRMGPSEASNALSCCQTKRSESESQKIVQHYTVLNNEECKKLTRSNDPTISLSMITSCMNQYKMESDVDAADLKRPGQADDTSGHQPIQPRYIASDSFEIDGTSNSILASSTVDNSVTHRMETRNAPSFDEGSVKMLPKIEVTLRPSSDDDSSLREDNQSHRNESPGSSNATESISDSDIIGQPDSKLSLDMAVSEDDENRYGRSNDELERNASDSFHNDSRLLHVKSSLTIGTDFPTPRKGIDDISPAATPTHNISGIPDKGEYSFFTSIDLSVGETIGKSNIEKPLTAKDTFSRPSWRLHPSESFSDFELQVLSVETGETTSYHVHKHMVAVGERNSEYMNEVFASENTCTFQVTLDEKTAGLIPAILDFLYSDDEDINITTQNAVPLRQLGKMLKIVPLELEASDFILQDIDTNTLSQYVTDCCFFNDEDVTNAVVAKCCERLGAIPTNDRLWILVEPRLFLRIVSSPHIDRPALSSHISMLVKEYLDLHRYEVSADLFGKLTSQDTIPIIDRNAAIPIIELCQSYESIDCEALQKRCAYTVASYWNMMGKLERQRLFSLLRTLPSSLTVDFLEIVESSSGESEELRKKMEEENIRTSVDAIPKPITLETMCGQLIRDHQKTHQLSWRLDPEESYSDWDLHIRYLNHQEVQVYHVHRHILAVGENKGTFFAQQFGAKQASTGDRGCTAILLDCEAASVFPQVLDFIYSKNKEVEISNENSVPLHYVARVLGISALIELATTFIESDLSLTNVIDYIIDAGYYKDTKSMALATRLCAQNIMSIGIESDILKDLEPDLFERIVSCDEVHEAAKCHVNVLITKYFSIHNIDGAIAERLLKSIDVKQIDKDSALNLLQILSALTEYDGIETFEALKRNCAMVITEHWGNLTSDNIRRKQIFSLFPSLTLDLVVNMFDSVDIKYRMDYSETMSLQVELVERYREQAEEASRLREEEVSYLQRELEIRTAKMLSLQKALESKLNRVDDALNRSSSDDKTSEGIEMKLSDMAITAQPEKSDAPRDSDVVDRDNGNEGSTAGDEGTNPIESEDQSCTDHQSACTANVETKKGVLGCCD